MCPIMGIVFISEFREVRHLSVVWNLAPSDGSDLWHISCGKPCATPERRGPEGKKTFILFTLVFPEPAQSLYLLWKYWLVSTAKKNGGMFRQWSWPCLGQRVVAVAPLTFPIDGAHFFRPWKILASPFSPSSWPVYLLVSTSRAKGRRWNSNPFHLGFQQFWQRSWWGRSLEILGNVRFWRGLWILVLQITGSSLYVHTLGARSMRSCPQLESKKCQYLTPSSPD